MATLHHFLPFHLHWAALGTCYPAHTACKQLTCCAAAQQACPSGQPGQPATQMAALPQAARESGMQPHTSWVGPCQACSCKGWPGLPYPTLTRRASRHKPACQPQQDCIRPCCQAAATASSHNRQGEAVTSLLHFTAPNLTKYPASYACSSLPARYRSLLEMVGSASMACSRHVHSLAHVCACS